MQIGTSHLVALDCKPSKLIHSSDATQCVSTQAIQVRAQILSPVDAILSCHFPALIPKRLDVFVYINYTV